MTCRGPLIASPSYTNRPPRQDHDRKLAEDNFMDTNISHWMEHPHRSPGRWCRNTTQSYRKPRLLHHQHYHHIDHLHPAPLIINHLRCNFSASIGLWRCSLDKLMEYEVEHVKLSHRRRHGHGGVLTCQSGVLTIPHIIEFNHTDYQHNLSLHSFAALAALGPVARTRDL